MPAMGSHRFDVLIVTALLDELAAVLALGERGRAGWNASRDSDGYPYHHRTIRDEHGTELLVAAASFDKMGGDAAAARAATLVKELDPACLAMCGICAGNKKDVRLGDVIVADRVYRYDNGKLTAKRQGLQRVEELHRDIETYNLRQIWRVDAAYFARDLEWTAGLVASRPPQPASQDRWLLRAVYDHATAGGVIPSKHPERAARCPGWTHRVKTLRSKGLLEVEPGVLALTEKGTSDVLDDELLHPDGHKEEPFQIHVGPIATGEKVAKDPELFGDLERFVRKTLGVEMEAAAIGMVGEQLGRRAIIVKGVSDYGDGDKDDSFRAFAARASAEVLIQFLLRRMAPAEDRPYDLGDLGDRGGARFPHGDEFLAQVERACRLKMGDSAQVQRVAAPPPFGRILRVSVLDQGKFSRIYPVAAVEQITGETLDGFLRFVDDRYRASDPRVSSTLVYRGAAPPPEIVRKAEAQRVLVQSFIEYQGLIDFGGYLGWQTERLEKDLIYPPGLYVDQRAAFSAGFEEGASENALGDLFDLLASPHGRFVLVLGDFGTGKTFLLHELARRMAAEGPLVPVLVEMRSLEKAAELNSLIAQHLALAKTRKIDLDAFRYMLSEGRIALLFDGFDELALRVGYDRAAEHFDTLIQAAQGSAKVVVTSRTQHFISDNQVRLQLLQRASLVQGYRIAKLEPFNGDQIRRFLMNRLPSPEQAEARFQLLDEVKDLLGLSKNPRLLSFIAEIPEADLIEAKKRQGRLHPRRPLPLRRRHHRWLLARHRPLPLRARRARSLPRYPAPCPRRRAALPAALTRLIRRPTRCSPAHRSHANAWWRQTLRARRCALLSRWLLDDSLSLQEVALT
jgi:nucleoside phosphorylase